VGDIGGQDLILKHPDLFTLAATWDFPADMSSTARYTGSAGNYGTDPNFQNNYQLTESLLDIQGPVPDEQIEFGLAVSACTSKASPTTMRG
jgi:hypothetical protein